MKIHFIGIGGIGVSALAKYYLEKGHKVSGSDLISSEITEALEKLGAKIFIGTHKSQCLKPDVEEVIYSPAVPQNNPELKRANKLGIKCFSYPEALGELTKKYFTIAVCGSHGKSTVAAMIGILLTKAGLDPTVILGTKLKEFGDSNCRVGKSPEGEPSVPYGARKYLVIEADEHFASFLNYWPKIIVLTTLQPDHLDYYKNFKNYILAFKKFISHLPPPPKYRCGGLPKTGILVANKDDKNIYTTFSTIVKNVVYYSLKQKEKKEIKKILKIPGEFNVSNALATLVVARILEIPDKISLKALSKYQGSWRRFEIIKTHPFTLISDYGHHPTQIKVTLEAAREKYPKKKIFCIFQPHQYQRVYYLFSDFIKVLKKAPIDNLIITDIYDVAGREDKKIKKKVNSKKIVKIIGKPSVIYLPKEKIIKHLKENLKGKEVVIIMGAGDIYKLCQQF